MRDSWGEGTYLDHASMYLICEKAKFLSLLSISYAATGHFTFAKPQDNMEIGLS